MHKHLITSIAFADANVALLKNNFGTLTKEQLAWKPAPDSWSVGECIEHLTLTTTAYFALLEKRITEAHAKMKCSDKHYKPGFVGKIFIKNVSPQEPKKTKTFPVFTPPASFGNRDILSDFVQMQATFKGFMEKSEGLSINKVKVASPVSRFFRLSLGELFEGHLQHQLRHFAQAERVMQQQGFPK